MPDTLTLGREAIRRHDWDTAREALVESDESEGLSPEDLIMLGDAFFWSARPDEAVEAYERAYSGFVEADRRTDAAAAGGLLAYFALRRHNPTVAGAWISRMEALLDGEPMSAGHAWLCLLYAAHSLFVETDLDLAIEKTDEALDLVEELRMPGMKSLAMSFKGTALIQKGQWREGVSLMDEATVVAMSEGSDLRTASDVYCNTIAACANLGDFKRAGEWTEEAERWMHANSVGGYTGVCQVHRAQLKRIHGSWPEAEETARKACHELERFRIMDGIGFARYEIGEVRRQMGDLDAAEEAFEQAYEYGNNAQPGYSLLLLDRGEVEAAAKSIAAALAALDGDDHSTARLSRANLLPAQIEIALAAEDMETANRALKELRDVAEDYDSSLWSGYALACEGSVALHEGNTDDALDVLKRSWRIWRDSDMPYESAKARTLLGTARQASGDETGAAREFKAARSTFERLGATRDLEHLRELTGEVGQSSVGGSRVTRTFMFTDIVTSTDLIGLIGDAAWENLLNWHDRTLREVIADHGGEEVRHTGDGFFVAFESPRSGIEAAVAIQRRLEKHRRDHGFSPWVRIGLHEAEATREKGDYAGGGVHLAARVGAIADREEVLVSSDLLKAVGKIPYETSDPKSVAVKGVGQPVDVQTIDWR